MEMSLLGGDEEENRRSLFPWQQSIRLSDSKKSEWPHMIWFILKITGLFYHRNVVTKRWCISCEVDNYKSRLCTDQGGHKQTDLIMWDSIDLTTCYEHKRFDDELNLLSHQLEKYCKACETCWWDRYGKVSVYTEADIGAQAWNHRGSRLVSVVILLVVASLILFETIFTENKLFAKRELLLHFMSYTAFLCPLFVFPVMNICSKVRSALSGRVLGLWATSLNARYIVQRLQYLDLSKDGLPSKWFLVICLVWPICCSTYRAYITFALKGYLDIAHRLNCLTVGITEFMWGCFVYILFLMRLSFQIQLELVLDFIKKCEGDEDLCQRVVRRLTVDFRCFRDCVAVYMAMMIPLCVLGASTSITWQYLILAHIDKDCSSLWCVTERNINIMIWMDVLMFSSLGPLAIGGFNVDYLWENFQLHVKFMQNKIHQKFWNKIVRFLERTEDQVPYFSFTTILSVVSLYMAFNFDEKDIDITADIPI
ncbi:hypothetical protein HOLleu_18052 [Holothuria leucospilota]|uniref:Uncharacterized protein n=1 Tax=Holothuria leucospilota TaxID=206669 RepID=A0A9Q1H6E1_HOLLE|nr:hypothetical protein HOLleu_18052 [Holothuria leucospilota]